SSSPHCRTKYGTRGRRPCDRDAHQRSSDARNIRPADYVERLPTTGTSRLCRQESSRRARLAPRVGRARFSARSPQSVARRTTRTRHGQNDEELRDRDPEALFRLIAGARNHRYQTRSVSKLICFDHRTRVSATSTFSVIAPSICRAVTSGRAHATKTRPLKFPKPRLVAGSIPRAGKSRS